MKLFNNWKDVGFCELIANLPADIRDTAENFNAYFIRNYQFSPKLIQKNRDKLKNNIKDCEEIILKGPNDYCVSLFIDYNQETTERVYKKLIELVSVLIECSNCETHFYIIIKPKTHQKYRKANKDFQRGCPNCRYPNKRTKIHLFFGERRFDIERYHTTNDKIRINKEKEEKINDLHKSIRIFNSENIPEEKCREWISNGSTTYIEDSLKKSKYENMELDEFKAFIKCLHQRVIYLLKKKFRL